MITRTITISLLNKAPDATIKFDNKLGTYLDNDESIKEINKADAKRLLKLLECNIPCNTMKLFLELASKVEYWND